MIASTNPEPVPSADSSSTPASPEAGARDRSEEGGQGMVEYALILVLIAIAVLVALQVLGHTTNDLYSNISNGLHSAGG